MLDTTPATSPTVVTAETPSPDRMPSAEANRAREEGCSLGDAGTRLKSKVRSPPVAWRRCSSPNGSQSCGGPCRRAGPRAPPGGRGGRTRPAASGSRSSPAPAARGRRRRRRRPRPAQREPLAFSSDADQATGIGESRAITLSLSSSRTTTAPGGESLRPGAKASVWLNETISRGSFHCFFVQLFLGEERDVGRRWVVGQGAAGFRGLRVAGGCWASCSRWRWCSGCWGDRQLRAER